MQSADLTSPCSLYCGVCAILMADRDNNHKLKEKLAALYRGEIGGKGALPNSEKLSAEDIFCEGCLSERRFMHCRQCGIRDCALAREIEGCHQCDDFPCALIENFPMTVGKKVILRCVPFRREHGSAKWVAEEEARYHCPACGQTVFRGATRCNQCKNTLDLD